MDRESLQALRRVADLPLLVALGVALYAAGIWLLVVRAEVMPQGLLRILSVQRHLAEAAEPRGGVALLGSSVVLEGVDCGPLATALPAGTLCENLAWTGGNTRQWLLLAPALRASRPRLVILGLDLFTLLHPDPIPADRLAIAAWWRFVPEDELPAYESVLAPEELGVLREGPLALLLGFRAFPLNTWNERVREIARSDLRYEDYARNFSAPWVRRTAASPAALAVHLEQVRVMLREGGVERMGETARGIERLVERVGGGGATRFLLVLTPVHPELVATLPTGALDAVRARSAALAERIGAGYLDDTRALAAGDFSDAVHPFGAGRERWSQALGAAAAPRLAE